jgi:hypothetical protein
LIVVGSATHEEVVLTSVQPRQWLPGADELGKIKLVTGGQEITAVFIIFMVQSAAMWKARNGVVDTRLTRWIFFLVCICPLGRHRHARCEAEPNRALVVAAPVLSPGPRTLASAKLELMADEPGQTDTKLSMVWLGYLNDVVGLGPGPRQRGGVIVAPYHRGGGDI